MSPSNGPTNCKCQLVAAPPAVVVVAGGGGGGGGSINRFNSIGIQLELSRFSDGISIQSNLMNDVVSTFTINFIIINTVISEL